MEKQTRLSYSKTEISLDDAKKNVSAKVFDIHGNLIPDSELGPERFSMADYLRAGIYILHVSTERGSYTKRIVKSE